MLYCQHSKSQCGNRHGKYHCSQFLSIHGVQFSPSFKTNYLKLSIVGILDKINLVMLASGKHYSEHRFLM